MAIRFFAKRNSIPEAKSSIPLGVVNITGLKAHWSGRNATSLSRNGFLNNPVGFRCVKLIAETAAALDLKIQDRDGTHQGHPVLSRLERPNIHQSRVGFFEELYGQFLLSGNAFIEASFDEEGELGAFHVLRSDRMTVVPGNDGWPIGYEYVVGKETYQFSIRDGLSTILHIKSFHPSDDHYGLSPLMAAASSVDVHNSACQWSKALLDNAARPSGAIVYKGVDGSSTLSQTQYSRLIEEIETNHQGATNAGRPMLLEGGLDWKPMGFSPSDMEFHRTKEAAARDIALALGVPPMLLGLPGDNTYANYQEANRAFIRLTILPLVRNVISRFSSWLQDHDIVTSGTQIVIDLDQISALSAERDAQWQRISGASFLTDTEKRELLGFPIVKRE